MTAAPFVAGRRVLVTGADGFIGSHLAAALLRAGAEVTALALYNAHDSHGWLDDLPEAERGAMRLVRGDVRDPHQMAELCRGQEIVFHLAALIAIPYSYAAPASYVDTNVHGTLNLLEGARRGAATRFVHTSTSEVYGTARVTPIDEDHPLQPQSPYAASKQAADAMVLAYHRSFGLPAVILRPFNTYGPRQSERALIPTVIRQALDPRRDAIALGDLAPRRDFNYVDDTVGAFLAVAALDDGRLGETFNAGSGRMVSIGETVERIRTLTGTNKPVRVEGARIRPPASEVMALMADSRRLATASGWTPAVDLEAGLARTVAWWRGRVDGLRGDGRYMV